jgi:hypothetical protein
MKNICRTLRRFVLSLDMLDISVKHEIYESKIFSNAGAILRQMYRPPPRKRVGRETEREKAIVMDSANLEY